MHNYLKMKSIRYSFPWTYLPDLFCLILTKDGISPSAVLLKCSDPAPSPPPKNSITKHFGQRYMTTA